MTDQPTPTTPLDWWEALYDSAIDNPAGHTTRTLARQCAHTLTTHQLAELIYAMTLGQRDLATMVRRSHGNAANN